MITEDLRLTIELVPSTVWYKNLHRLLPKKVWDNLRRSIYAECDHHCGICGAGGRMNCHEVWEYDLPRRRQILRGFVSLCNDCHMVKHIGRAQILAHKGQLDLDVLIGHFLKVNRCDRMTFEMHQSHVRHLWRERSACSWILDLGEYQHLAAYLKEPQEAGHV